MPKDQYMQILGVSGSLRADSFNTRLLRAAADVAGTCGARFDKHDITGIPLYSADADGDAKPQPVVDFLHAITEADGVLFATPEYNYSIPGVLKNAIDWASRPAFNSPLTGKPCGVVSASMSSLGGARAQVHLREILSGTLSPVFLHPGFLLASAHKAFDATGGIADSKTRDLLDKYVRGFVAWLQATNHA